MSKQSKFFQVTKQVLLEYTTDQYKITNINNDAGADATDLYMYIGEDGDQYCIEKSNISSTKYSDSAHVNYYYPGNNINSLDIDETTDPIFGSDIWFGENNVGTIIKDTKGNQKRQNQYINHDTIRIYLTTGYIMNSIAGYSIKVKGKVIKVSHKDEETGKTIIKRINDYITLLDWYMPKEDLKNKIKWLAQPLYLNSCFYDRYIEVSFPSPLDIALNNRNIDYVYNYTNEEGNLVYLRGTIDRSADTIIEFATVQPEFATLLPNDTSIINYESKIILDAPKVFSVKAESNSNNFNVKLFEDLEKRTINYYPVYGDINNCTSFNLDIMKAIETGAIPMIDLANLDSVNQGMDDFIEMYGDDVFRWVIINELSVSYNYDRIIKSTTEQNTIKTFTEYYTNTIDYTGKTDQDGNFYESKFLPQIKEYTNMTCKSINITYTAHLFNRMNNIDIIRTASMVISDPYKYVLTSINTNNITQYKIVNKINNTNMQIASPTTITNEKYVRSFYDVTNLVVKDEETGNMYSQGKMTLYLKHSGSNYNIKLFTLNNDNVRVPFDLTGPYDYKLVFPSISGSNIEIMPIKDAQLKYNLNIGSLLFYISKDNASAIMNVPASERYFSLTTHIPNNKGLESTLYEGHVEWNN